MEQSKMHCELNTNTLDVLVKILIDLEQQENDYESARTSEEVA